MKLIRSGSTIIATSPQQSGSMKWPIETRNGRILQLADSHLSGNTVYDMITNQNDGAEWTQVGDSIRIAVSASTNSQFASRIKSNHSFRFWDTGVKARENPVCTMEFATLEGATPHNNNSSTPLYLTIGFCTAPEGGIEAINFYDNGTNNYGITWSSIRWLTIKFNSNASLDQNVAHRQGAATISSFSGNYSTKHGAPTNYRSTFRMTEFLDTRMDGSFLFTNGFSVANYPASDGDGDASAVKTIATDSPIGQNSDLGDHHIYAMKANIQYGYNKL